MPTIIKANGSQEPFNPEKIRRSIERSGIPPEMQDKIVSHVTARVHDNMDTAQISYDVTKFLEESDYPFARSRYKLKQALMQLGPTGYPFEDFVSEILVLLGYTTKTRQILMGKCVNHEVDIVAEKGESKIMIEAKFHNSLGIRSDVRVPLYTKSRFEDLKDKHLFSESWVITNTKVTTDAIAYAECVGMKIIGWSYPEKGSLRDIIEETQTHPVTILNTLNLQQKAQLLANHVVTCKSLMENKDQLSVLRLTPEEKKDVEKELDFIVSSST